MAAVQRGMKEREGAAARLCFKEHFLRCFHSFQLKPSITGTEFSLRFCELFKASFFQKLFSFGETAEKRAGAGERWKE